LISDRRFTGEKKMAFIVDYRQQLGTVPPLSKAVMGHMGYNLLSTGVYLQKKLEDISEKPLLRRTAATLCTGNGIARQSSNVYTEDPAGNPVYDFTLLDQLLDVIVGPRSIPFFGISFMPEDLSAALPPGAGEEDPADLPPEGKSDRIRLSEPWMKIDRFPPKDYERWYELIFRVVEHCLERYGEESVSRWYWVFWNEPDLRYYWPVSHEEFFKTYDYAAAAVKAALPDGRVGGCEPADPEHPLFEEFLLHCTSGKNYRTGEMGAPLDFITFHVKGGPSDKKRVFINPWEANDFEERTPSLAHIMEKARKAMKIIQGVKGTQGLPVFLTECDIDWGTRTSIYQDPNMHYRNSEYFASFQCALTKRMLDLRLDFMDNPIEATFLDTFYYPGFRLFEGQRTLITGERIDKPILNALRLLGKLGDTRLAIEDEAGSAAELLATCTDGGCVQVMAVNFVEDFHYSDSCPIEVRLQGLLPGRWMSSKLLIDKDHSNAYTAWLVLGRPLIPNKSQMEKLRSRMVLEEEDETRVEVPETGALTLNTEVRSHGVVLWILERLPDDS
jgi:xylan 1,4-beta-xylosidase